MDISQETMDFITDTARAKERERCAKIADGMAALHSVELPWNAWHREAARALANTIRQLNN